MVVVPAVVASEYLAGIDPDHHEATLAAFRENFEMPPFDHKAVSLAAKLWRVHRALPAAEQLQRIVLKSDVLIIATLKSFGVTHYYSDDGRSRRFAEQAGLVAHELPGGGGGGGGAKPLPDSRRDHAAEAQEKTTGALNAARSPPAQIENRGHQTVPDPVFRSLALFPRKRRSRRYWADGRGDPTPRRYGTKCLVLISSISQSHCYAQSRTRRRLDRIRAAPGRNPS